MKCHALRGGGASAQLTSFFVVMLIPLSLLIALAVDLGGALAYRTWQGSLLESTRQSCFGEANAVKYAENPGDEARSEVLEMLKANGYTGKATVYYVEAPESLCGAADRYAGVYVVLEGTWPSSFARFASMSSRCARTPSGPYIPIRPRRYGGRPTLVTAGASTRLTRKVAFRRKRGHAHSTMRPKFSPRP